MVIEAHCSAFRPCRTTRASRQAVARDLKIATPVAECLNPTSASRPEMRLAPNEGLDMGGSSSISYPLDTSEGFSVSYPLFVRHEGATMPAGRRLFAPRPRLVCSREEP